MNCISLRTIQYTSWVALTVLFVATSAIVHAEKAPVSSTTSPLTSQCLELDSSGLPIKSIEHAKTEYSCDFYDDDFHACMDEFHAIKSIMPLATFTLKVDSTELMTLRQDESSSERPTRYIPGASCSHEYDQCQSLPAGPAPLSFLRAATSILQNTTPQLVFLSLCDAMPLYGSAWPHLRVGPSQEHRIELQKPPEA